MFMKVRAPNGCNDCCGAPAQFQSSKYGVGGECSVTTPYVNTIPAEHQAVFPGSREIERRIKSIIRWNAMAMVVGQRRSGIGGHISTYASSARRCSRWGSTIFSGARTTPIRATSSIFRAMHPGCLRACFCGRAVSEKNLENFRRELDPAVAVVVSASVADAGVSGSFRRFRWGSADLSIYQARFNRYLENRGLKKSDDQKIWAFLGDGELDEPETLGPLPWPHAKNWTTSSLSSIATCSVSTDRCAATARSSRNWKPYSAEPAGTSSRSSGAPTGTRFWTGTIRACWCGEWKRWSTASISSIPRPAGTSSASNSLESIPNCWKWSTITPTSSCGSSVAADTIPKRFTQPIMPPSNTGDQPTVILAKTIKGYGLGEAGEGRNDHAPAEKAERTGTATVSRSRFGIPISDEDVRRPRSIGR